MEERVFYADPNAVPSAELMAAAAYPDDRAELYRSLGLTTMADNATLQVRIDVVRQFFIALDEEDLDLYRWYLSQTPSREELVPPLTDGVAAALLMIEENETLKFDSIELRTRRNQSEFVLWIGHIGETHFLIGQYGNELRDLEFIRNLREERRREAGAKEKERLRRERFYTIRRNISRILLIGITAGLLSVPFVSWYLDRLSFWPMAIAVGFIGTLFLTGSMITDRKSWYNYITSGLVGVSVLGTAGVGYIEIDAANNVSYVREVDICEVYFSGKWYIRTQTGEQLNIDPLTLDGQQFPPNSPRAGRLMVDHHLQITTHGSHNNYVTEAITLGPARGCPE